MIHPERTPKVPSPNLDPEQVISKLRSAVTSGDLDLNSLLQRIAEAAQALTGATGAAIAIRHNGRVVCLARAGEIAPDLGTPLDVDSGISGKCLHTGQALRCADTYDDVRVDVDVCRRLGLRSLAVVPLLAELGVIGVLEAFSDLPYSFPDRHLQLLKKLAKLVAAAWIRFAEAENSVPMGWLAAVDHNQTARFGGLEMTGLIRLAVTALAVVVIFMAIRRPAFRGHSGPPSLPADRAVEDSNPGQSWVSRFNELRSEKEALTERYSRLEQVEREKDIQVAALASLASEVSVLYGLKPNPILATNVTGEMNAEQVKMSIDQLYALKNSALTGATTIGMNLKPTALTLADWIRASAAPAIWPVMGKITGWFGERIDPFNGEGAFHRGVDISTAYGEPVVAPADAQVAYADFINGYGRTAVLEHGHGMTTLYGHLARFAVIVGQEVRRGDVIGYVGLSGRSTGPHLHYEVRINDVPVNPHQYLRVILSHQDAAAL